MNFLKSIAFLTIFSILVTSCQKDEPLGETTVQEVPKEVLDKIERLGVNPHGVVPDSYVKKDGTKVNGWLAHDIFFSKEDLATMDDLPLVSEGEEAQKAFRTTNIVSVPERGTRTITIRGVDLDRSIERGLRDAVSDYNRLRLRFRLELSFGRSSDGEEITVEQRQLSNNGGQGTFPSRGNPGNLIIIDPDNADVSRSGLGALLLHELGHNFGLRHSDWRTRSSCSNSAGETADDIGAIHIPGTNTSSDFQNSIMKACNPFFSTTERFISRLTSEDRRALRELYR